jgi:hypothetical protein
MGFGPKRLWLVLGRNVFLSGAMFVYFGYLGFFQSPQSRLDYSQRQFW